jgi:serine/threonine-protein kinase
VTVGRFFLTLLLIVVAIFGGIVLANSTFLPWLVHRQKAVLVPELKGLPLVQAKAQARRLGLRIEVGDEVYQDETPPGIVLEQAPRGMRSVRKGRAIRLVVSKGEAYARVPDLLGMSLRQCEISLLRENLKVGRVARSYDPVGRTGIAAQRPQPGAQVPRATPVDVLLREEREPQYYRVPSFVGRSLVKVRAELSAAGFELRRITYAADAGSFPGTILKQWPLAGSRIVGGGSIELVASKQD